MRRQLSGELSPKSMSSLVVSKRSGEALSQKSRRYVVESFRNSDRDSQNISEKIQSPANEVSHPLVVALEQTNTIHRRTFMRKWALKKMVDKFRCLSVQKIPPKELEEEWQKRIDEDDTSDEIEGKWMLSASGWPHSAVQMLLTVFYLLTCWYITVDTVFEAGGITLQGRSAWAVLLVFDVVLNLNTVKLVNGRALRTRWSIFLEYLRTESSLDLVSFVYLITCAASDSSYWFDLFLRFSVFTSMLFKLRKKGDILRTRFALKKGIVMIDSVLLLLIASHFSVQAMLFRQCFCSSPPNSLHKGAGSWKLGSKVQAG